MRTKLFLESTQNRRCFNVEFYRWISVDRSTLNQPGYHVDRSRDVISTFINVESTLGVCWVIPVFHFSFLKWHQKLKNDSKRNFLKKKMLLIIAFLKKKAASKNSLFWKSSCSEKVLYFEEVALLKK